MELNGKIYVFLNSVLHFSINGDIEIWKQKLGINFPKKLDLQTTIEKEIKPVPPIEYETIEISAKSILRDRYDGNHLMLFCYRFDAPRNLIIDDVRNATMALFEEQGIKYETQLKKIKNILAQVFIKRQEN